MTTSRNIAAIAALAIMPSVLSADGYERSNIDTSFLYENGNYAEFGFGIVAPSIPAKSSGVKFVDNVAPSFNAQTFAAKTSLGDSIDAGIWYASSGNGVLIDWGSAVGIKADLEMPSLVGMLKYNLSDNLSLLGGLKRITMNSGSSVTLPVTAAHIASAQYSLSTASATTSVYGIAYERPEIALRIELLAEGDADISVPTTWSQTAASASGVTASGQSGTVEAGIGDAITLKFQTGIAANTLLFGSVRNSKWKNDQSSVPFVAYIPGGGGATITTRGEVSDFGDGNSYTLGVGRKISDGISISGSIYSDPSGGCDSISPLSPTCGTTSASLGAKIGLSDNANLSLGYTWSKRGDATIKSGTTTIAVTDSSIVTSVGAKLSYKF